MVPEGAHWVISVLLTRIEKEDDWGVSQALGLALGKVGHCDRATVAVLLRQLAENHRSRRWNSVYALEQTALEGDQAVIAALLVRIEKEDERSAVQFVVRALGKMARADQHAIAVLLRLLE